MRHSGTRLLTGAAIFFAAACAGLLVSTTFGAGALRAEVEERLARVMGGPVEVERLHLSVGLGLRLEGHDVRVYPDPHGAGLRADRVVADLDLPALLIGRLRLRWLLLERPHLRLTRRADGSWFPAPLEELRRREAPGTQDLERGLDPLRGLESVARKLIADPLFSRRIEVRDGSVSFVDAAAPGAPASLGLEDLEALLDRRWLSRNPELSLRAELVDHHGHRTPVEAEGRRLEDGRLRLALSATRLGLEALEPYVRSLGPGRLTGALSGVLAYETPSAEHGRIELDWIVYDLAGRLPLGEGLPVASPALDLRAGVELYPGRLRLTRLEAAGRHVEVRASGVVERPLRESARASLAVVVRGTDRAMLESITQSLPKADRDVIDALLARIGTARIPRVGARGATRIARWRQLLAGDLAALPPGIVLSAELADVTVGTTEHDRLTQLGATVEWSGDRIEVRGAHARWNDEPLPRLDLALDGVSHLLAGPEQARALRANAVPLPGLPALIELLRPRAPERATPPSPRIELDIEELHHPILRWPLEDTHVEIEPEADGLRVVVPEARWAGAPIRGELRWMREPEPRLLVEMRASPREGAEPRPPTSRLRGGEWARGRVRLTSLGGALPMTSLEGSVVAEGTHLELAGVEAELVSSGALEGDARVELGRAGQVGLDLRFVVDDADVAVLGPWIGLPEGLATGRASLSGTLEGSLSSRSEPLAQLDGYVALVAREGQVRRGIPLIVAIAQATEGFNPLAVRDAVHYDYIESVLQLRGGRLATDRFTLEGPLRVFASGHLDFARPERELEALVGVFLFRQADLALGRIPLVGSLISDKGLVGAYFQVDGTLDEPRVDPMPLNSLAELMPDVVKAPLKAIGALFGDGVPPAAPRRAEERRRRRRR